MKKVLTAMAFFISAAAFAQGQFQNESAGSITDASDKIMQLAEAMPAEKYDWTPGEGVRSFAGVLQHVVSANYFFATKLGAELPSGVNMATLEQDLTTKEQLTAAVDQSSNLIIDAVKKVKTEDMGTKIEFPFPGDYTTMSAILIELSHTNEHLGQLIAYCRTNGVVPPWSQQ
jgi:uncharacterized damage-inducible protein DinB